MTPISTVNNKLIATTAAPITAATTAVIKSTTAVAVTISTTNSSTVKVSAAATTISKAAAAPAPVTVSVADALKAGAILAANTVIKDTAANIQSNFKALAALTPAANIAGITLTDTAKATISLARADVKGDLSAVANTDTVAVFLRKITTSYNLTVTGLTASDALTLKAPASSATLAMSVTDTAANLVANLDTLQTKVKAKSITALNIASDSAATIKPLISITTKQLTADIDALNALKGNFDLTVTGVAAVDAATTAGKADAILKAAASPSTMSKIAISDTSANISTNITKIELVGAAGRITSITVSDSKELVLTEAQILASTNTLNAKYTAPVKVEATGVAAADTGKVQTVVNSHTSLSLTKESISDTAANIAAKLDDLEKLAVPSSASGSFTLASIGVSDKGSITVSKSTLLKDLDALKIISGSYTLKLTDLAVADAIKITPPSKDATLSLTVSDTVSNVTANFDKLQTLAKAKSVSSITMTDASSAALKITSAQYKAGTEALGTLQGTYYLGITGVAMADMATSLKAKNIYSLDIVDTSANVIKNLAALQTAVSSAKIQSVTLTDTASFTLSISDAYNLMTSLPNLTLGKIVKINIADTASNIVAHTRDDIGDILKNAGTITVTDKTTPNLTLADATTLKSLASLASSTKYNVIDSGTVIATQAKIASEKILSGATAVTINHTYSIDDAKAVSVLGKGTSYGVADTVDKILAQQAIKSEKVVSGASFVNIVDTSANIVAKLDQIEALAKTGVITDIQFTDTPSAALSLTQDQLVKDAEAIGKIISQRTLPTLTLTKPVMPSPIGNLNFNLNLPSDVKFPWIISLAKNGTKAWGQYSNNDGQNHAFISNTDGTGFIDFTPKNITQLNLLYATNDGAKVLAQYIDQNGQPQSKIIKTDGTGFFDLALQSATHLWINGITLDGSKAWGAFQDENGKQHAFLSKTDGTDFIDLTPNNSSQSTIMGITPDGTRAWGSFNDQNNQTHAFIVNIDNTDFVNLTPQSAIGLAPVSSINGLSLDSSKAWGSFYLESGQQHPFVTKINGTGFIDLSPYQSSSSQIFGITPDGTRAWGDFYDQNGQKHAFSTKIDGTGFVDLTPNGAQDIFIRGITPDSANVYGAFSDQTGQFHSFITKIDGTGFIEISPNNSSITTIMGITPDGTKAWGQFYDQNSKSHAFTVKINGIGYEDITPSGSVKLILSGSGRIPDGKIFGTYQTIDQKWHGFTYQT